MSTRPTGHSTQFRLGDEDSATLNRIIRDNPSATLGRIRLLFRKEAGLDVAKSSIVQRRAYLRRGEAPGRCQLTPGQREALAELIRDDEGASSSADLASAFGALVGRTIAPANVARFRRKYFPEMALAYRSDRSSFATVASRRIAEASARKLARSPVDRSPRVGKAGRVHPQT